MSLQPAPRQLPSPGLTPADPATLPGLVALHGERLYGTVVRAGLPRNPQAVTALTRP